MLIVPTWHEEEAVIIVLDAFQLVGIFPESTTTRSYEQDLLSNTGFPSLLPTALISRQTMCVQTVWEKTQPYY